MFAAPPWDFECLSTREKSLVNDVCHRFAKALRGDKPTLAEAWLDSTPDALRLVVLRELLLLECEHRWRLGGSVPEAELFARFPDHVELVVATLADARRYAALAPADEALFPQPSGDGETPPVEALGRFRLKRVLGRGGAGVVYLAFDPNAGRDVALKVPHAPILLVPELRRRFLREADAARDLAHPGLVPILDVGEAGVFCFIASEYVAGQTLAKWLEGRNGQGLPVPAEEAARQLLALAQALQYAHEHGVLHCDLTPANILLPDGEDASPRVTDFGLARLVSDKGEATRTGQIIGTPAYMAPEQAEGRRRDVTARTDVYALGVILYELLSGRPPFTGDSLVSLLNRVIVEEAPRLLVAPPGVPGPLEAICLKCLEKDPDRRYATAQALAEDLRRFVDGEPTLAKPVGWTRRAGRWCRRNPAVAALLGVLAAAVIGLAGLAWHAHEVSEVALREQFRAEEQTGLAEGAAAEADRRKRDAEDTRDEMQRLVTDVVGHSQTLARSPTGNREVTLQMLNAAEARLEALLGRKPGDREFRRLLAVVLGDRGAHQLVNGNRPAGRKDLLQAQDLLERLVDEGPDEERPRVTLACLNTWLGRERAAAGDVAETILAYRKSLAMRQGLVNEHQRPQERCDLYIILAEFASFLAQHSPGAEAESLFARGEAICAEMSDVDRADPEACRQATAILNSWAVVHEKNGRPEKARRWREEALVLASLSDPGGRRAAANSLVLSSHKLRATDKLAEALEPAERGTRILQVLCEEHAKDPDLWADLSSAWYEVGKARWKLSKFDEALTAFRASVTSQRRAFEIDPTRLEYRTRLSKRYESLFSWLQQRGCFAEAAECLLGQEQLWPKDEMRLRGIAEDYRVLAAQAALSPPGAGAATTPEAQRFHAAYERLGRAAEAAERK